MFTPHMPRRLASELLIAVAVSSVSTTVQAQTMAHGRHAASASVHPTSTEPAPSIRYGAEIALGNGFARSYVTLDERALDRLPAAGTGHHGGHEMPHTYLVDLPAQAGLPFRFVELNWNPVGHEPDGVYQGVPHFDFHFYTISREDREAIVPTDPQWAQKANHLPDEDYVPPFNVALGPPGAEPSQIAVPMMGLHWVDIRSAELQELMGKPEGYRPFTATFIHGTWDGRVIFWEPMITRAYLLSKKVEMDPAVRDEVIAIPTPARYQSAGYYPSAYRITWDATARQYRIALTHLAPQG